MIITDIQPQSKNQNRVSIFINGNFAFGMDKNDCSFMGLKIGYELTQEKYDFIVNNTIYSKAYQKADRFIGYKMRTEKEVRSKLIEDGYTNDIIDRVISTMIKYKYIDDEAYAIMYAKDCKNIKKWGPKRIKTELYSRGITNDVIDSALESLDISDIDNIIIELLEKRIKNTPIDLKEKQKHLNFLLRRGFNYEDVKRIIERYC